MRFDPERRHRRSIRLKGYDYSQAGAYFVTICTQGRACLFGQVIDGEMQLNDEGRIVQAIWDGLPEHYANVSLDAFVIMPNHVHGIVLLSDHGVGAGYKPAPTDPNGTNTSAPSSKRHGLPAVVRGFDDHGVGAGYKPAPTDRVATNTSAPSPKRHGLPAVVRGFNDHGVGAGYKPAPTEGVATNTSAPSPKRHGLPEIVRGFGDHGVGAGYKPAPTDPNGTNTDAPSPNQHGLPEIVRGFKTYSARGINVARNMVGHPVWQRNYYEHIIRDEESLNLIRKYTIDNPARWAFDRENPEAVEPKAEDA